MTSEVCDAFGFSLVLDRYGWSDLLISHEGGILNCRISAVFSDVAGEFLKLCRGVLDNQAVSVALFEEPGGHVISAIPDVRQQHTMLLAVQELGPCVEASGITGDEMTVLSMQVKRKQLLGLLIAELWKAHHFLSEPSFQKGRALDFPRGALVALNREWDLHRSLGPSFLK